MTTKVKVITHDWPVLVQGFPRENGEPVEGAQYQDIGRVEPNSESEFYVHSGMDLLIIELPLPEKT